MREYPQALDEDNTPTKTSPRKVSPTDPAASYTAAPVGPAFYTYSTNYLIDTDHGITVDIEPTTAIRTQEVQATKTMVDRIEARFAISLIGDTAYGTSAMLGWLAQEKPIAPYVPVRLKGNGYTTENSPCN